MDTIKAILEKAVTAPSGDNSQPWWFHFAGEKLEVHLYPKKDNQILNYKLSGTHIAIGALIENIAVLASAAGLKTDVELFPNPADSDFAALLTFTKTDIKKDPLTDFVTARCTNRKPYKKSALGGDMLNELIESGQGVLVTSDKDKIVRLANASSVMERVALETEAIHKLFFESIVWSEEEEKTKGMGLPIKTTELPPPIQLLFRGIRHWKVAEALNHIGLSFLASKANAQTYASSQAIGIVVANEFTKEEYVKAGRVFERVWLTATKLGLAFQPVTGVLFLAQRVRAGEAEVFNPKHIPLITSAYGTIVKDFSLMNNLPAMLFRIGYADAPSARTIRKQPEYR